ncbi:hypothetical protein IFM89_018033 [Coptis chinensis]|uniref:ENTH domain-containing protein n=1 Tax=Coptis chinensis TaxID=261450 RepID=A0A835HRK3_9MAGN|nr:hypothetical protein IFM89_018033 [Coptis chinensis]
MGTLILSEMRKRASGFLHEKYKSARLALTDVTPAELLTEEATNGDPWGPDAKTMTRITEASFDVDDYWRIVDVLHGRFYYFDWKQWRQSYKALVLLEFLLTHGPEDFAEEFQCDIDAVRDLGTFRHIDETGFNWGASTQKKSERILKLLRGGEFFKEARLKALKVTKEIKGFGNLLASPSSSSPSTPSSASSFGNSGTSFGSYSTNSTPKWTDSDDFNKQEFQHNKDYFTEHSSHGELLKSKSHTLDDAMNENLKKLHLWDYRPMEETGSLLDSKEKGKEEMKDQRQGLLDGIRSRLAGGGSPSKLRSISDVGKGMKKKFDRQFSMGN